MDLSLQEIDLKREVRFRPRKCHKIQQIYLIGVILRKPKNYQL